MLKAEAGWIGRVLDGLEPSSISPLLNVGSAPASFRERDQPWIDSDIFAPLRRRSISIQHLDIQEGEGIDLRGDLHDEAFVAQLGVGAYRAILCCNLLEHVVDPRTICQRLEKLVANGGYLVVTVPYRFPYHPDPIDTMFRPDSNALTKFFPGCRLVRGEMVNCGTGWDYVERHPSVLVQKVRHRLSGMKTHGGVRGSASFLPWLLRSFKQTCVLLQRDGH